MVIVYILQINYTYMINTHSMCEGVLPYQIYWMYGFISYMVNFLKTKQWTIVYSMRCFICFFYLCDWQISILWMKLLLICAQSSLRKLFDAHEGGEREREREREEGQFAISRAWPRLRESEI